MPLLLQTIMRSVRSATVLVKNSVNLYHSVCAAQQPQAGAASALLASATPSLVPSCGFKVKGVLKRRCKDCYFVRREDRLQVMCKTHPRHKQIQMAKKEKYTWILTHATQSKFRTW